MECFLSGKTQQLYLKTLGSSSAKAFINRSVTFNLLKGQNIMAFTKETKTTIISDYKLHDNDTGSSEVQIALLTNRLNYLTEHFGSHNKDQHSRQGLLRIVSRRRKLLDHLKKEDANRYQQIISRLSIRR